MNTETKIVIYTAGDVINTVRQAGATTGVAYTKSGIYTAVIKPSEMILDDNSRLRNPGSRYDNDIWLSVNATMQEPVDIQFIDAFINITKANKLQATELAGNHNGSVKEFIQQKDYKITIKGNLMTDVNGAFPYDLLKKLNDILNTADSIYAASVYLDIFGINKIAFETATFDQNDLKKAFNVMPFTLTFSSDMDYNFLIEEN